MWGTSRSLWKNGRKRKDYVSSMYSCVSLDALEPCLMASVCSSRSVSVGQSCSRITKRHTLPASLKGFHTWLTHPQPSLALQNESWQNAGTTQKAQEIGRMGNSTGSMREEIPVLEYKEVVGWINGESSSRSSFFLMLSSYNAIQARCILPATRSWYFFA